MVAWGLWLSGNRLLVRSFVDELAVAAALAADCEHRGTAGRVLIHPLRSGHVLQRPGEVTSVSVDQTE
jgi:hypothetical protein